MDRWMLTERRRVKSTGARTSKHAHHGNRALLDSTGLDASGSDVGRLATEHLIDTPAPPLGGERLRACIGAGLRSNTALMRLTWLAVTKWSAQRTINHSSMM